MFEKILNYFLSSKSPNKSPNKGSKGSTFMLYQFVDAFKFDDNIKTFYRHENIIDNKPKRIVTAVYKITDIKCLNNNYEFHINAAGCIFRGYDKSMSGKILLYKNDWDKKAHRETAMIRLDKNPIKLIVKIPILNDDEIIDRVRNTKIYKNTSVLNMYINYTYSKIEKAIRKSFTFGVQS